MKPHRMVILLSGVAGPALASVDAPHDDSDEEPHRLLLGAMTRYEHPVGASGGAHTTDQAGAGVQVGVAAVPNSLEVEVGVGWLSDQDGGCMPFDLLLKGVHHVGHVMEPYVGAGPMLMVDLGHHRMPSAPGMATVAGSNAWLTHHVGLFAEADYHHVWAAEPIDEVGAHVGIALGF